MRRVLAVLSLFTLALTPASAKPTLSESYARFAFDLLQRVRAEHAHSNVFLSPSSIAVALAVAANGAAGPTRAAILKTVHAQAFSFDEFNAANRELVNEMNSAKSVQLTMANALWLQTGFTVKSGFRKTAAGEYKAEIGNLDFRSHHAVDAVNAWAKEHTHGRIDKVLDSVDPATVAMIANAIAFKGKWTLPFAIGQTRQHDFTTASGAQARVPMMSHQDEYSYFEDASVQAVRLPYSDGTYAMYVLLPHEGTTLDTYLQGLEPSGFSKLLGEMARREGTIELPRFQIAFNTVLNDPLRALGMGVAFGRDADFSNVHQPPPPIVIDQVRHSSFLKVDEEGTEAAAVTTIGMKALAMPVGPPPFHMVVDRPFFLAIRNDRSGQLLFVGTIADPRA